MEIFCVAANSFAYSMPSAPRCDTKRTGKANETCPPFIIPQIMVFCKSFCKENIMYMKTNIQKQMKIKSEKSKKSSIAIPYFQLHIKSPLRACGEKTDAPIKTIRYIPARYQFGITFSIINQRNQKVPENAMVFGRL